MTNTEGKNPRERLLESIIAAHQDRLDQANETIANLAKAAATTVETSTLIAMMQDLNDPYSINPDYLRGQVELAMQLIGYDDDGQQLREELAYRVTGHAQSAGAQAHKIHPQHITATAADIGGANITVTAFLGEDGTPVAQIDTDGSGTIRINLNDTPIWEANPEQDDPIRDHNNLIQAARNARATLLHNPRAAQHTLNEALKPYPPTK